MCKYKVWKTVNRFYAEGNNGGDHIIIENIDNDESTGMVKLTIGHCCVHTIEAIVPVEFITAVLTQAAHDGLQESMKKAWSTEYGILLAEKIKKL